MNLKFVNNLGTIVYTIFFGKEVGKDEIGNRYFIAKNNLIQHLVHQGD